MKRILYLLAFTSTLATASMPIEVVSLTPELVKSLGFSVEVQEDGPAIIVNLKGPAGGQLGCVAFRSGVALLGQNTEELLVHITELPNIESEPEALGYYTDTKHKMGVFIDYNCTNSQTLKTARYYVESIGDWLP